MVDKKMSLKQKEHWQKKREKGKLYFIISEAVIWGTIMAVVHTIITTLFNEQYGYLAFMTLYFLKRLVLALLVFWFMGSILAFYRWVTTEERYIKS